MLCAWRTVFCCQKYIVLIILPRTTNTPVPVRTKLLNSAGRLVEKVKALVYREGILSRRNRHAFTESKN